MCGVGQAALTVGSTSFGIGSLASQVMSSNGDDSSDVTGVSRLKRISEDNSSMFKTYLVSLEIYSSWYELYLCTCSSGDLSAAPSRGEEHDALDIPCLYKDTMHEDAMEFGKLLFRAPTQQELNIGERDIAYDSGDMDKVASIDESEEECRKQKRYHRNVRKYFKGVSKASSSNEKDSSQGILCLCV